MHLAWLLFHNDYVKSFVWRHWSKVNRNLSCWMKKIEMKTTTLNGCIFLFKKIIQPHQCDNQFLSSFNPQRRVLVKKWVFMQKILKLVNSAEEFWIACCLDHFECVFYGVGQFNFCRNDFKNIQKKHINLSLAAHFLQMKHHTANLRNGLLEHVQLFNGTQCTYYPFSIFSHWKIVG